MKNTHTHTDIWCAMVVMLYGSRQKAVLERLTPLQTLLFYLGCITVCASNLAIIIYDMIADILYLQTAELKLIKESQANK